MDSTIESEAYEIIDIFLNDLINKKVHTITDIKGRLATTESQIAKDIICREHLISFRKGYEDRLSRIDITPEGLSILKLGGYQKYLDLKKQLREKEERQRAVEIEKTQIDLELSKKYLEDYPKTKKIAWIGLSLSIIVAIIEVIKLFWGK
jgi:hypothetical protein